MDKLLLILSILFSSNLISTNLLAEVNIDLLKQKYSNCKDTSYRHECFDDYEFSTARNVGYFRNNTLWDGLHYQKNILIIEFNSGKQIYKSFCNKNVKGWTTCPSGNRYRPLENGYFDKNKKRQGKFRYEYHDGSIYVGEYKDGKIQGQGALTWESGDSYIGNFVNGNFHGQGTYTYANGIIKQGIWKDDKFMYAKKSTPTSNFKIEEYKSFCSEIGLTIGTDSFNECLLVYKNKISSNINLKITKESELEKNKIFCKEIGLVIGSDKFNECLIIYNDKVNSQIKSKVIDFSNLQNDKIIFSGSGTGFAVASNGYIITNYHVIDGCNVIKIHNKNKIIPATLIKSDSRNDIALIKGSFISKGILPFSNKKTELLQEIYVAGYPFGDKFSTSIKVTKGIVSALTGIGNNFSNFQIDAAIQPGNSGGPILNKKGNVIGVVVAKLDKKYIEEKFGVVPENTNFGIKIDVVKSLLDDQNIKLIYPNEKEILTSKLGQDISNSTYSLSCWKAK